MVAELELTDPLLELVFGSVLDLGVSRSKSYIFESSLPCPYWGWGWFLSLWEEQSIIIINRAIM